MWLADILNGGQPDNKNTRVSGANSAAAQHAGGSLTNRYIQALRPGETLQGEVVAKNGSQVQIKVSDDMILEARVDGELSLEIGRLMSFEVRNNGQNLMLSPLFANTASQANALKALEMASLPVNQTTVSMTGLMMEAGLPIDRASLQQMFREVTSFPEANLSDIVDLHRLGLEVNEENLAQIDSYKNLTYKLVDGMREALGTLPESMRAMVSEGNAEGAVRIFQGLLQMAGELTGEEFFAALPEGDDAQPEAEKADREGQDFRKTVLTDMVKRADDPDEAQTPGGPEKGAAVIKEQDVPDRFHRPLLTLQGRDGEIAGELAKLARALGDGNLTEQVKALQRLLEHGIQKRDTELLEALVSDRQAGKTLTEGIMRLWTVAPEEVADPDRMEELYSRLDRQLKSLAQTLEQNGQSQSPAFKAVNGMSQNLDFMQQINQAYTYVQIPLRLQQGEAHGELYVYTNKRNLSAGDGQISALLHLDMDHLGPVDVYVAMQAEHVNTRFYVRDDEMLDFLEKHMDLLTARLQKRGYSCDFAMQVRERGAGEKSGVMEILAGEHAQPISMYAFDVRA